MFGIGVFFEWLGRSQFLVEGGCFSCTEKLNRPRYAKKTSCKSASQAAVRSRLVLQFSLISQNTEA